MSDELLKLRQAIKQRSRVIEQENALVDDAVLVAYRARRTDGTPGYTLTQIGEAFGVSRQRAFRIVREAAARREPGSRTGSSAA